MMKRIIAGFVTLAFLAFPVFAIDSVNSILTLPGTLTNKAIDGGSNTITNIPNSALVHPKITINGSDVNLGDSVTVTGTGAVAGQLPALTTGVTPAAGYVGHTAGLTTGSATSLTTGTVAPIYTSASIPAGNYLCTATVFFIGSSATTTAATEWYAGWTSTVSGNMRVYPPVLSGSNIYLSVNLPWYYHTESSSWQMLVYARATFSAGTVTATVTPFCFQMG